MTKAEIQKRLEALRAEIREHDYKYYVSNRPEISDVVNSLEVSLTLQ